MTNYSNKRLWAFIVLCFSALIVTKMINDRIVREIQVITVTPRQTISTHIAPETSSTVKQGSSPHRRKPGKTTVRKDRFSPGRDYLESIYYLNEEEIARQKIVNEKVIESSGEIPEGRVDFVNESQKTYGTEHYRRGKKNGSSLTYFNDGRLNIEAHYQWGKLLRKKEYYNNGDPRLEISYEDARTNVASKEAGDGKVYYKNGIVKYEWHFTQSDKVGYQRSYNPDGALRAAFYFDENGQPVE